LVAFGGYMVGVFALGALAHHLLERGSFLKQYFLGDRKLNAWVLALTYVATSVSAGSFVGFPSWIYLNGWVMAFWIAGYMVAGLVTKGVLAKRLNQVSRLSGAITVPDVLRDRFQSPALGLFAGIFLVLFLVFNLVGQFKAGGFIMRQAAGGVRDTAVYRETRGVTVAALEAVGAWDEATEERRAGTLYDKDYPDYVLGILIFALTVVAYTTYGGFWAVTWTDVLQGLMIVAGAILLMVLALHQVGGLDKATTKLQALDPNLVTAPGPNGYLPVGLAISFFFLWTIGAMGQPVGMVRLMACPDTPTLRRSLFMIGIFYALIYLPLVITFVCARALYPHEYVSNSDTIMPAMAIRLTTDWPLLGGLILAAPYAAAMSAVAGFLLLMSSSLVRDIYQRNINPNVSKRTVRWISYGTTAVVGIIVTLGALHPPRYLQFIIIFTGSGLACTFLGPVVLALYWRRATRPGALASLFGGAITLLVFYVLGWSGVGKEGATGPAAENFAPLYLFGLDPLIYGFAASFGLGIVVSLLTRPLPASQVDYYFLADAENQTKTA
jgi:SSS family solute:Na+ symporter/sodium/pantothenate symporter